MMLIILSIYFIVYQLKKCPLGQRLITMLKNKLFFNSILRYLIQSYLKFSLLSCTQIVAYDGTTRQGIINASIAFVVIQIVIIFPVWLLLFLSINFADLSQPDMKAQYDSLYLGLDTNIKSSIYLTFLFLLRRLYLAALIILAQDSQMAQIFGMQLFSMCMIVYLLKVRPLDGVYFNALELFNECLIFICATLTIAFSDMTYISEAQQSETKQAQSNIGWVYIGIACLNIGVVLGGIIYQIKQQAWPIVKEKVIQLYKKWKSRKDQVFTLQEGISVKPIEFSQQDQSKIKIHVNEDQFNKPDRYQSHVLKLERAQSNPSVDDDVFVESTPSLEYQEPRRILYGEIMDDQKMIQAIQRMQEQNPVKEPSPIFVEGGSKFGAWVRNEEKNLEELHKEKTKLQVFRLAQGLEQRPYQF